MALAAGAADGFGDPLVGIILILSTLASIPLAVFGLLAYRRRRSTSYLFVAIAFVLFLLKSILGGVSLVGGMSIATHHLLEHGFDFLIAVFLLSAVYVSRRTDQLDVFAVDEPEE